MAIEARVGIVGGNGWLGSAIASAALRAETIVPQRLTLSGRSDKRGPAAVPGVHWTTDNAELVERSDIVVLSVRPQDFQSLSLDARGKLVVSVMASVPAAVLADATGAEAVVRAMPNAAAAIGRSFTPWHASPAVTPSQKAMVKDLLGACGEAVEVPEEAHVDYSASVSGTGAAYPALLAAALIRHAPSHGLPAEFAERMAAGVVAQASQLLLVDGASARGIVDEMIEYRGMTAASLVAMRDRGFDDAVVAGLDAALARAAAMATK